LNLSYFIARRYLFSKRKTNFINIISGLSIAGVAFSTAALIIVLSVFNGLEDLLRSLNSSFDPEIKIQSANSKSFEVTPELLASIKKVEGVEVVTDVIEDYAYLRYRDANQVVTMKGVGKSFLAQDRIPKENIVEGQLKLQDDDPKHPRQYAIVGRGVQFTLSIAINDPLYPLQFYYIKNGRPGTLDPSQLYSKKNILAGGAFSIVQTFDENYVIVPLEFAEELLNYGQRRTSLEIKTSEGANVFGVERQIQEALGEKYNVLNHEEQHKDLYKLLRVEKLFTFLALTMLLLIGSINIFFSLMMLALDKKKDISILFSMGANSAQIRDVFIAEGALIAFIGALVGLALGGAFCWVQHTYGIISMGMETSITQGYPVKVKLFDFIATLFTVSVITLLISAYPARLAARVPAVRHL
jgi:lipoprotein-releasing system permease protein